MGLHRAPISILKRLHDLFMLAGNLLGPVLQGANHVEREAA